MSGERGAGPGGDWQNPEGRVSVFLIRRRVVHPPILRVVARMALRLSPLAIAFLAAGRADWGQGWLLAALFAANLVVVLPVVYRLNPEVIRLRMEPIRPERGFDRVFVGAGLGLFLGALIVAGLDSGRHGWSRMGWGWSALGAGLYIAGMAPVAGSLVVNRFLATTVSIQRERGHRVVSAGPYRVVRHPMYAGLMLIYLSVPLILGSWWAYLPIGLIAPLLVFRTAKEDATLRAELEGYEEFARRTRYRLIPGVW